MQDGQQLPQLLNDKSVLSEIDMQTGSSFQEISNKNLNMNRNLSML